MMKASLVTLILFATILSGCETFSAGESTQIDAMAEDEADASYLGDGGPVLRALPESTIPKKECGMILWTLDAQRPVAVFRYLAGGDGEIQLGESHISLGRLEYNGASGFGVFENQTFRNDEGVEVEVSARFGLGFDGGAYLERGLLKVRDASGWSVVAPVAGIAGCRG